MGIDRVNTKSTGYTPITRRAKSELMVDGITPVEKPPNPAHQESRAPLSREGDEEETGHKKKGIIDERV